MDTTLSRSTRPSLWVRMVLPMLAAALVVIGSNLIAGSYFIEIEDRYINGILGGMYGAPEAWVQIINPLLAQLTVLLYNIAPAINWYGVTMLFLVFLSGATAMSLTAHKPGGLIPGFLLISPLLILMTCSLQSQVIAAFCAISGTLCLLDGLRNAKEGVRRILLGLFLVACGLLVYGFLAILMMIFVWICALPFCLREKRMRAQMIALPLLVLVALALQGYSWIVYHTDEARQAYRDNYATYEFLQESPLRDDAQNLLRNYGNITSAESGIEVDRAANLPDQATALQNSIFYRAAGWSINDADLFFRRNGADPTLTDPAVLKALAKDAPILTTDRGELYANAKETLRKPQFLMLLALYLSCALLLLVTNRRRGLMTLLSAIIALGGHLLMLMLYRISFCDIAPFYILGILVLLSRFDPDEARAWWRRVFVSGTLRGVLVGLIVVCGVVGLTGLTLVMRNYNNEQSPTLAAAADIDTFMLTHPDAYLIGDNPLDRYNVNALAVPTRGSYQRMLLGSYDLYSPRATRLMQQAGMTNPLLDAVGRSDIYYVSMSFIEPVIGRIVEHHGRNDFLLNTALENSRVRIYQFVAATPEEVQAAIDAAQGATADHDHDGDGAQDHGEEAHDEDAAAAATPAPDATAVATPEPTSTPSPSATATSAPMASPAPSASASPASNG